MNYHWNMENGQQAKKIEFTVFLLLGGQEQRHTFEVPNLPCDHNDPNTFSRIDFEFIQDHFKRVFACEVGHIIRGEITPNGSVRDCYVYAPGQHVPFATIRPSRFVHG